MIWWRAYVAITADGALTSSSFVDTSIHPFYKIRTALTSQLKHKLLQFVYFIFSGKCKLVLILSYNGNYNNFSVLSSL